LDFQVEIDESKFGKRKYHRGHRVDGVWVFGIIERESGQVIMIPVAKRSRAYLLPIIKHYIMEGTTIISDCWRAYDCLDDEGFEHLRVNHSINFVDPDTGAHTNRIESSWGACKAVVLRQHRNKRMVEGHLAVYLFQKSCRIQGIPRFEAFCRLYQQVCNPSEEDQQRYSDYMQMISELQQVEAEDEQVRAEREQRMADDYNDIEQNGIDLFMYDDDLPDAAEIETGSDSEYDPENDSEYDTEDDS
jgi:transposase-like protein